MKEDEWILHTEELNRQDAEASFASYFQLKKNNMSFFFFFRKKKKQKTLFFSQAMSFLSYMSFLCSKKRFCLLLRCLVFSAICQNLTVNFWFYHLFSKNEKKEQLLKVQGMWIFFLLFISILKPFIPNPSLKIWQHTI